MVIRVPDQRNTPGGYSALDDRLLVLDFQAGNPQAFVEIHRRYGALARHVCQRFLPRQQDADEAFQETMIRVFQGLYRFNGRYALQPWIARIAKNVSLDILRGHARRPQTDDSAPASDELPIPGDEADEIVERLVQRDTVLSVLADLPETHRRALMLRELEGRSHREVAQEMEISTAQAKALIHRAKGSFRRRWLEQVSDRGGFAAVAFLPLLWAARFGHHLRKFVDKAGVAAQTAQAAAPEAVSSTVTATASAAPAASGVAERVVAAGMTILLAGGVTVGAAKIVRSGGDDAPTRAAATHVTLAVEPVGKPAPSRLQEDVPPLKDLDDTGSDTLPVVIDPPAEIDGPPAVDPSQTEAPPAEAPPTEPSPSPDPEPSPTPEPPPPQPPPYDFAFGGNAFSGLCPCLMIATPDGNAAAAQGGGFAVRQSIDGRAVANGEDAYGLRLEYDASLDQGSGSLSTSFYIDTPGGGWYTYRGSASLISATQTEHGWEYELAGSYQRTNGGNAATDEVPDSGSLGITIRIWTDGHNEVYGVSFNL